MQTSDQHGILDQDLGCPQCGYNLRGLGTGLVTCPECGHQSDFTQLITRRWDKPWYRAPKYNLLCLPAAWLLVAALIMLVVAIPTELINGHGRQLMLASGLLATVGVWALLMVWVWRSMDGPVSTLFALLVHVPIAGYLLGVPMALTGTAWSIAGLADGEPLGEVAIAAGLLISGVALFAVSRWLEKVVAGHCIRLYLKRLPTS